MGGETGGWGAGISIPFKSIGHDAAFVNPLRGDGHVQQAGAGVSTWRPQHPVASRLNLGGDNPADLGWLLFE